MNEDRLRRILTRMLDESEFLSPYGLRALSRHHSDHPYNVTSEGHDLLVTIFRRNPTPACSVAIQIGAGQYRCR